MYPLVGTASGVHRRRNVDQGILKHQPNQSSQYQNLLGLSTMDYLSYFRPIGDLLRNYKKIPFQVKLFAAQNWGRGP